MSKNKDPAVLFYTSDFLAGTRLMSYSQIGKYITLLCLQHQNGHFSEQDMLSICGEYDDKIFFKFDKDENGCYYNARMEEEINKRRAYSESRSRNGKNGGRPTQQRTICLPYAEAYEKHSGNENINVNINKDISINIPPKSPLNDDDKIDDFDEFWRAYPKKVGKEYARRCFAKLRPSKTLVATMISSIEKQKKSVEWSRDNGQYIPNPSTWLNQGRWEDELTVQPAVAARTTGSGYIDDGCELDRLLDSLEEKERNGN